MTARAALAILAGCLAFLVAAPTARGQSGGRQVCFGAYVLCDAAACESTRQYRNGGDIDCYCRRPGPGLNIGNTPCDVRTNLSTYSLSNIDPRNGTPSKAWGCTASELIANGKGWAFCLDAPCRQDTSNPGGWTCRCKYVDPNQNPGTMYTFGLPDSKPGSCARDCSKNWSGSTWSELLTGYSALAIMHTEHIPLDFCDLH
jgi:hypothetical protein